MMTNDLFQPQSFAGKGMEHGFMVYPDNTTSDIITGSNDRLTFRFSRELQYTFHTHPLIYDSETGEVGSFNPSPEDMSMVNTLESGRIHLLSGYRKKYLNNESNVITTKTNYEFIHTISFYNQNGTIDKLPFDRFIKNIKMIWENK